MSIGGIGTIKHHVMFDVDGTLVQSCSLDTDCFCQAVRDVLGITVSQNWSDYTHATDAGILNEIIESHQLSQKRDEIFASVKNVFVRLMAQSLECNPVLEVPGAREFLGYLKGRVDVSLSIATGGWGQTALMKLTSAGIDVSDMPMASSNDHYSRIEIMGLASKKADVEANTKVTYFGDAAWDKQACEEIGFSFVLVGDRIKHGQQIESFKDQGKAFCYIGLT